MSKTELSRFKHQPQILETINSRSELAVQVQKLIDTASEFGTNLSIAEAIKHIRHSHLNSAEEIKRLSEDKWLSRLREAGRVHGLDGYKKLGIATDRKTPKISRDIVARCLDAPVKSMIVFDSGVPLRDLERASRSEWTMNLALKDFQFADEFNHSHREFIRKQREFATERGSPGWCVVPMEICMNPLTLGLEQHKSIDAINETFGKDYKIYVPNARDLAIGILLHHRETGEKLFPFQYTYSHTSSGKVVVGSPYRDGFEVREISEELFLGRRLGAPIGLAPVGIKRLSH